MTLGAFAVLGAVNQTTRKVEAIDDLAGLSRTRPALALLLTLFLFSLTGLPPTAGFLGKLNLFIAAWGTGTEAGHWLAIWLAVNATIGAWYYLRIIGTMYLQPPTPVASAETTDATPSYLAVALCAIATLGLFAVPGWLWAIIQRV